MHNKKFAKAVKLRPESALYHQWLGETEARLGQWEPAVRSYRDALKLDPEVGVEFYQKTISEDGRQGASLHR